MNLFSELKRRNVFKVAIAYLMLSWLILQLVDVVSDILLFPDWVAQAFLLLLAVLLPVTLIMTWAFELTPDGVKKTADVDLEASTTKDTSRKINYIIIGAMALIIGGMAYERLTLETAPTESASSVQNTASIAVLPFVNMSSDPEQEYFSDGISEEILNVLAKIPNLHITSRSSAFSFKGKGLKISDIARELGVVNVLEGSVRKSGTKVRITAQLIEAASDKHLWSETYDRDISDIFAVQDEISAAIVAALKEELGLELSVSSTKSSRINPEAFDLYLQGQQSYNQKKFTSLEAAVASFKATLALEPDFQAARIALARTLTFQIYTGSRSDPALLGEAEALLNIVLEAEPDNGRAYYVLALIARERSGLAVRLQHIKQAYSLNPNDAGIITEYALSVGSELGEVQARALFTRAERLDPLNSEIANVKAFYLQRRLQAYSEAEEAYKRAMVLNPSNGNYHFLLGQLHGFFMGDIVSAIGDLDLTHTFDPNDPDRPISLSAAYLSLGDSTRALEYADLALNITATSGAAARVKVGALMALGRTDEALTLIETSFDSLDVFYRGQSKIDLTSHGVKLLLDKQAYDQAESFIFARYPELKEIDYAAPPQVYSGILRASSAVLAAIYRASGKQAEAKRITDLNKSITKEMLIANKIRLAGRDYYRLAHVGMGRLNYDEIIDLLEASIDGGFLHAWRQFIDMDPVFMPLHTHPRYVALIERIEAEMVRQLALVNARDVNQ